MFLPHQKVSLATSVCVCACACLYLWVWRKHVLWQNIHCDGVLKKKISIIKATWRIAFGNYKNQNHKAETSTMRTEVISSHGCPMCFGLFLRLWDQAAFYLSYTGHFFLTCCFVFFILFYIFYLVDDMFPFSKYLKELKGYKLSHWVILCLSTPLLWAQDLQSISKVEMTLSSDWCLPHADTLMTYPCLA